MSMITVFGYEFYVEETDGWVRANPLAPLPLIEKMGWRAIKNFSMQVESSQLREGERFHPPSNPST